MDYEKGSDDFTWVKVNETVEAYDPLVGIELGWLEGFTVGWVVGEDVGCAEGKWDGFELGCDEGKREGFDVGEWDGSDVGADEGWLGAAEGASVGGEVMLNSGFDKKSTTRETSDKNK